MTFTKPDSHKVPILPEGAEIWIGLVFAVITWWVMYTKGYPVWAYAVAILLVYVLVIYIVNLLTEDYRMWARAMKVREDDLSNLAALDKLASQLTQLRDQNAAKLKTGLKTTYDAISSLDEQKRSGVQYSGYSEIATWTGRLLNELTGYVKIKVKPEIAGDKLADLIKAGGESIDGYCQWSSEMIQRISSGDIFNMTTNAMMLRSLRNLLKQ